MSTCLGFYLFECESTDNTILTDTRFPCIYISNVSNCGINSKIKNKRNKTFVRSPEYRFTFEKNIF